MYFRALCFAVLAIFCTPSGLAASSHERAIEVFKYAFRISGGKATMRKMALDAHRNEPAAMAAAEIAISKYNIDELTDRVAGLVGQTITEEEAEICSQFIRSNAGNELLAALESADDQRATEIALMKIPALHRQPIDGFMRSSCYQKASNLFLSQEVLRAQAQYGTDLMCAHYKETDARIYSQVVKLGACKP
jgi:GR25 family glycosyltransferase involved in LPS biosynthesis